MHARACACVYDVNSVQRGHRGYTRFRVWFQTPFRAYEINRRRFHFNYSRAYYYYHYYLG